MFAVSVGEISGAVPLGSIAAIGCMNVASVSLMPKPVPCPKCRRTGTYSEKFRQCSACGLGYSAPVKEAVTAATERAARAGERAKQNKGRWARRVRH